MDDEKQMEAPPLAGIVTVFIITGTPPLPVTASWIRRAVLVSVATSVLRIGICLLAPILVNGRP